MSWIWSGIMGSGFYILPFFVKSKCFNIRIYLALKIFEKAGIPRISQYLYSKFYLVLNYLKRFLYSNFFFVDWKGFGYSGFDIFTLEAVLESVVVVTIVVVVVVTVVVVVVSEVDTDEGIVEVSTTLCWWSCLCCWCSSTCLCLGWSIWKLNWDPHSIEYSVQSSIKKATIHRCSRVVMVWLSWMVVREWTKNWSTTNSKQQ